MAWPILYLSIYEKNKNWKTPKKQSKNRNISLRRTTVRSSSDHLGKQLYLAWHVCRWCCFVWMKSSNWNVIFSPNDAALRRRHYYRSPSPPLQSLHSLMSSKALPNHQTRQPTELVRNLSGCRRPGCPTRLRCRWRGWRAMYAACRPSSRSRCETERGAWCELAAPAQHPHDYIFSPHKQIILYHKRLVTYE